MATWVTDKYPGGSRQDFAGDEFPFKVPPRIFVLHSTETKGYPTYPYNNAPHVTCDPVKRTWRQHRPLNKPSWSLKSSSSVSTNSWGTIQLEIIGYAASLKDITDSDLAWVGGLIAMLMAEAGIPVQAGVTFGGPETSGTGGTKRLSPAAWNSYVGILGHQHVPSNSHWDPGALDIDEWLRAIKGQTPEPEEGEWDMLAFGKVGDIATVYVGDGITRRPLNGNEFNAIKFMIERGNLKGNTEVVVFSDEESINGGLGRLIEPATVDVGDITVDAIISEADKTDLVNRTSTATVEAMPKTLH